MPVFDRIGHELYGLDGTYSGGVGERRSSVVREPVTPAFVARAESSSEAAALPNGEKALTPIIAGSISGSIIGVAWIVAVVYALVKRHRRKKRYKKAGRPDLAHEQPRPDAFIVPPDPAVVMGERTPGERVYVGRNKKKGAKELAKMKEKEKLINGEPATTESNVDHTVDENHVPTSKHTDDVRHALADIPEDDQMNMPSPSRRPTNTSNSIASYIAIDDAALHAKKKKRHDKEKGKDHLREEDFAFDEHSEDHHETSHSRHGHEDGSKPNWPW
ncbi:hypothetical protein SCHPADRAFT_903159 [Schizopora paradoxa]|uniref:Uncharacterized protein n=1 Tax=Schizopora paradoxa TaxID=27342 RepID=A0A0H2SCE9_9AGAM|nr:hypothetical protein SCHPADRAFT_903159 [Schizopora paradoxa]